MTDIMRLLLAVGVKNTVSFAVSAAKEFFGIKSKEQASEEASIFNKHIMKGNEYV